MNTKGEKLFNAIGAISDDKIATVDKLKEERADFGSKNIITVPNIKLQPVRRAKGFSVQLAGMAAGLVLIAGLAIVMLHFLAPETPSIVQQPPETPHFSQATDSEQTKEEEPPFTNNSITWLVEPTLHQWKTLQYCKWEDAYLITNYEGEGRIVNETTGQLNDGIITDPFRMNELSGTESTSRLGWLYDPDLDLFGWWGNWSQYQGGFEEIVEAHPMSELAERFPVLSGQIIIVTILDTVAFAENPVRSDNYDPAFGGSAVMYNGEFVTDFIFSFDNNLSRTLSALIVVENYNGVARGWQSSIVDSSGNVLLPFEFIQILLIDENTAFAQTTDGYWGIIEIPSTPISQNLEQASPHTCGNEWLFPCCGVCGHCISSFIFECQNSKMCDRCCNCGDCIADPGVPCGGGCGSHRSCECPDCSDCGLNSWWLCICDDYESLIFRKLTSPPVQKTITEKDIIAGIITSFNARELTPILAMPPPGMVFAVFDSYGNSIFSIAAGGSVIRVAGEWYSLENNDFALKLEQYYELSNAEEIPYRP